MQVGTSESKKADVCMTSELTDHDQKILDSILTQSQPAQPVTRIDLTLPPDQRVATETVVRLVEIEKQAILLQKDGNVAKAIELINNIITEQPKYASAYNNRAQLYRVADPSNFDNRAVTSDLESAIALALPEKAGGDISKMQASTLRNAYGQFAAIYLGQSKLPENAKKSWDLQLRASEMMVEASRYGERIAATLAVAVNPYAKLCGNMMEVALAQYH